MSQSLNNSRFAVLGASRGLGAAVIQVLLQRYPQSAILGLARKSGSAPIKWMNADVSRPEEQDSILNHLEGFAPEKIICTLGGGPYGLFQEKAWRDHQWCFEVSFMFPARLLHWSLSRPPLHAPKQLIFCGSSVAEDKPDPRAASYSASKHALHGLVSTVQAERPSIDVRLFSPGYMNTELLPTSAQARQQGVWDPLDVAKDLVNWMDLGQPFDHRRLAIRPPDR